MSLVESKLTAENVERARNNPELEKLNETEHKLTPSNPDLLASLFRADAQAIEQLYLSTPDDEFSLRVRAQQPYIDTWTLPYGKLHVEDASVLEAAQREAFEKLGLQGQALEHAGDCYIRVSSHGNLVSTTLAHVFRFYKDDIETSDDLVWARPHKLHQFALAPAVEEVMTRTFFKDAFYFEEFSVDWS